MACTLDGALLYQCAHLPLQVVAEGSDQVPDHLIRPLTLTHIVLQCVMRLHPGETRFLHKDCHISP